MKAKDTDENISLMELMTKEALEDVDNGRLVSHESVMAWANSLSTDQPLPIPSVDESCDC